MRDRASAALTVLAAAAAIIAARAEREGLPHWRDLADRLSAAEAPAPKEEQ